MLRWADVDWRPLFVWHLAFCFHFSVPVDSVLLFLQFFHPSFLFTSCLLPSLLVPCLLACLGPYSLGSLSWKWQRIPKPTSECRNRKTQSNQRPFAPNTAHYLSLLPLPLPLHAANAIGHARNLQRISRLYNCVCAAINVLHITITIAKLGAHNILRSQLQLRLRLQLQSQFPAAADADADPDSCCICKHTCMPYVHTTTRI